MGEIIINFLQTSLYSIILFESIFFVIVGAYILGLIQISVVIIFMYIKSRYYPQLSKWGAIRLILRDLFFANQIIENKEKGVTGGFEIEPKLIYNSQQLVVFTDKELIQDLRYLGLDAILICLFLLQYEDQLCNAKELNRNLDIPNTSVYRNLQKLQERELIKSRTSLSDPKSTFYEITYEGKLLVKDLYDLISVSSVGK